MLLIEYIAIFYVNFVNEFEIKYLQLDAANLCNDTEFV